MTTAAPSKTIRSLAESYTLGRTGLKVSPLCLGAMTFGTEWGWGADASTVRKMVDRYLDAGGNFIDTADMYTNGKSEEMVGDVLKGRRDRVVLATKFTFNAFPGDPNAGGNGRKNIYRALEGSLKRLQTDYVDLYWLHAWDGTTPVEEVMATIDALVRSGKVRHFGLSDTPAWYIARAQTLAEWRGWEKISALQLEYSLIERNIEREHIQVARELGIAVCPWSPLGGGFLTGKYLKNANGSGGKGRLETTKDNPIFNKFTDQNWKILDALLEASKKIGKTPAQVALNWATKRPGVVSTLIGATSIKQLDDNLGALEFDIPAELSAKLEQAGRPDSVFPYKFFEPTMRGMLTGGTTVKPKPDWA